MEALIRVTSAEFNRDLFEKLRALLNTENGLEILISIRKKEISSDFVFNESEEEYFKRLADSVNEVEQGKTVIFTMEKLQEYLHKNFTA